ncbi:MAG: PP2C family protein-serine/threonine phosphatase, partial [Planctomycetota bacterium]
QALSIARTIQQDQLPREEPCIEGFDVSGASWPADETGGDVFDWMDLGDGRLTLMLADATGHGIGPALIIVEARAMVRALSGQCAAGGGTGTPLDIPAVLGRVNNMLAYDLDDMRFVTCFLGLADGAAGTVRWASAGQGPVILYDRGKDAFEQISATGVPLGVIEGYAFDDQIDRSLAAGDILTLVTDGFFEACDGDAREFGIERLCEVIRASRDLSAAEIIAAMYAAVDDFTAGTPQADDLTAVVVKRLEC